MLATTATTILDCFRVLAWPVVALLIAFMFREKIRSAIPRVRKFWIFGSGAELDPAQPQEAPAEEEAETYAEGLDLVEYYEQALTEQQTEAEQLQQQLAVAELRVELEMLWNRIYGSQINALRQLRDAPNGLTREALKPIHADAQARRGLLLPFDTWMEFLIRKTGPSGSFVTLAPDGTYLITQKGVAFLGYGEASGYRYRPYEAGALRSNSLRAAGASSALAPASVKGRPAGVGALVALQAMSDPSVAVHRKRDNPSLVGLRRNPSVHSASWSQPFGSRSRRLAPSHSLWSRHSWLYRRDCWRGTRRTRFAPTGGRFSL